MSLKYTRLSPLAFSPIRATNLSAGVDLVSPVHFVVPSWGKHQVFLDLAFELPLNTYGRIAPRSGLAWNQHISIGGGVIDADYRGNVAVILFNHSDHNVSIMRGDKIAQLICEEIQYPILKEVSELSPSDRGICGFGSTGSGVCMSAHHSNTTATPYRPEHPSARWCPDSMYRSSIRNRGGDPYIHNMEDFLPTDNDHPYAKPCRPRGLKKQGRKIQKTRESAAKPKVAKEIEVIDLTKEEEDEVDEVDTPTPLNLRNRGEEEEEKYKPEECDSDDIFQQSQKF